MSPANGLNERVGPAPEMKIAQKRPLVVVGDRFRDFALSQDLVLYGDLAAVLRKDAKCERRIDEPPTMIYLGQGLSSGEIAAIKLQYGEEAYSLSGVAAQLRPCDRVLVHKANQRNVMISEPQMLKPEALYRTHLMLDDACDDMADHLTGYHLQGTVLSEAVRQSILAISEAYLLPQDFRGKMRFATRSQTLAFEHYAFPIDLSIELQVTKLRRGPNGNFVAQVQIILSQQGQQIARGTHEFSAFSASFMEQQELGLASGVIACL